MENNNGAEKLISSILQEAHEQASAIEWRSAEAVAAIKQKLEKDKDALRDEFTEKAQSARELTLATARTNAELTGRKRLLERKRALIDSAYGAAYERICALKGSEREALLARLLERECAEGDVVCPSEKDAEALKKLVSACSVKGLALGEISSVTDGFTVMGANYVKDCSFAALMEDVRAETSTEVARILFN